MAGIRERIVTHVIETARLAGVLICSNSRGYWRPLTRAEVVRCIRSLRRRAQHQLRTAAALERALSKADGLLP